MERLANRDPAPLEFHMHHRKAVDENRDIVAILVPCSLVRSHLVLMDHLQGVHVDILLVDERDILRAPVVAP